MADSIGAAWAHVVRLALKARPSAKAKRALTIAGHDYELHLWFLSLEERETAPKLTIADRLSLRARAVVRANAKGHDEAGLRTVAAGIWPLLEQGGALARYRNAAVWPDEPVVAGPYVDVKISIHRFGPLIDSVAAINAEIDANTVVLGVP